MNLIYKSTFLVQVVLFLRLICRHGFAISDVCLIDKDRGTCLGYVPSYYYDSLNDICKRFVYGGCDGNSNKFPTKETCESSCVQNMDKSCLQVMSSGPCTQHIQMYYYEPRVGKCLSFLYSGCEGNSNRFDTLANCENKCIPKSVKNGIINSTCFYNNTMYKNGDRYWKGACLWCVCYYGLEICDKKCSTF